MRSEDPEYNITRNGKYINSTKVLSEDVTELVELAYIQTRVILNYVIEQKKLSRFLIC